MREVRISGQVWDKISTLELFLKEELKFSKEAARKRSDKMRFFLKSLSAPADYSLCRFRKWRELGYRCVVFEKSWVFAYEILDSGIIIRDMSHTAMLKD
ncbi:MAG: hypothetical protein FWE30_01240 [Bacteroidales bacterium]|nr:hypothetical protein [Bacteroidales bacterium]MCL2738053.1 hypothetical protein [Bacteroidales bacterium]